MRLVAISLLPFFQSFSEEFEFGRDHKDLEDPQFLWDRAFLDLLGEEDFQQCQPDYCDELEAPEERVESEVFRGTIRVFGAPGYL